MIQVERLKNIQVAGKHGRPILTDVFLPIGTGYFPTVIFVHGFKGFKDWGPFNQVADEFAKSDIGFVKLNFAFNGTSPDHPEEFVDLDAFGNNNISKELDDIEVIIEWIIENQEKYKVDLSKLSLLGHSRGGGVSILKGADDPRIHKIAAWASLTAFEKHITSADIENWKKSGIHYVENSRTNQMMPLYIQLYDDYIKNAPKFDIVDKVRNLKKDLFMAHAIDDDTIPFSRVVAIKEQNPIRTRLLELQKGGHTFDTEHPFMNMELPETMLKVVQETIRFFKE